MPYSRRRGTALLGVLVCAAALVLGLVRTAAAERRGIDVAVVKKDGTRVSGELCAVRPNSVVVQESLGVSAYTFINVSDIRFIERARISTWLGAATGLLQWGFFGAIAGDVIAFNKPSARKRMSAVAGGLIGGSIGALLGALKGAPTKRIATIDIEGQPRDVVVAALRKLGADARIRDAW
jgi:hypothetical protein